MAERQEDQPGNAVDIVGWLCFWVPLAVLVFLAVIGAFFAGRGSGPGDYGCGLILTIASLALAFMRIKHRFDEGPTRSRGFLLVDDMSNLVVVVPLFVIIGLAGLFLAASWGYGALHNAGIALFGASGLAVFLSLKRVFDTLDRHR